MELSQHPLSVLDFMIGPDLLSSPLGEDVILTCALTNQKTMPFRLKKDWKFTHDGHVHGTLKCDITLDGKVYDAHSVQSDGNESRFWSQGDIVILKQGDSHIFTANITEVYPLTERGTYAVQATFQPEKLKGVMVTKCKPVLSNLILIEIW